MSFLRFFIIEMFSLRLNFACQERRRKKTDQSFIVFENTHVVHVKRYDTIYSKFTFE